MQNKKKHHSSCKMVLYRERPKVRPNSVLFIDNRPEQEHSTHVAIDTFFGHLRRAIKMNQVHPEIAHLKQWQIQQLNGIVESHMTEGTFRDTTRIADWIGAINRYAQWRSFGAPELELVIAHAETHAEELCHDLVEGNSPTKPAGIVLSGSPKMISEVIRRHEQYPDRKDGTVDPAVARVVEIIKWALAENIPILGICFGMHLLAYARFGVIAQWLHVPDGMGLEYYQHLKGEEKFKAVAAGERRMVFGSSRVLRTSMGNNHPMMNAADRKRGLEVHSQYIDPAWIDDGFVLADSYRVFCENENSPAKNRVTQRMLEVFAAGPHAVGTQLHPELQPWSLFVLSHFRSHQEAVLGEGQDLDAIRAGLLNYSEGHHAGQRVGYNWVKRILAPWYIERLQRLIRKEQAAEIARRIEKKVRSD